MANWNKQAAACAAALMLSACGGGGGSNNGGTGTGTTAPSAPSAPAPGTDPAAPASAPVLLQGTVRFEAIPHGETGGLDHAARFLKPARGVTINAVDPAGNTLATGSTDALGHYALAVPSATLVVLQVFAHMPGSDGLGVAVADNTSSQAALWGVATLPFLSDDQGSQKNLLIPAGWNVNPLSGAATADADRPAAPFAILDTIYQSQASILAAAPDTVLKPLLVLWSPRNTPAYPIDLAKGQIGNTHFSMVGTQPVIVLLGQAEVDTDEYDASVITHEWAHYYQATQSRSDSVGGVHDRGDALDRNVAFAEGWGNAWAGIALDSSLYQDAFGPGQAMQLSVDLAAPPTVRPGWFNEDSVRYVLWQLNRSSGFAAMAQAFTGPFKTVVASTGIHSFNAALASVSPTTAAAFAALLSSQSINPEADAWGIGETNAGGSAVALPMVQSLAVGSPGSGACVSNQLDPSGEGNKLGDYAYLRFTIAQAGDYRVTVTGPAQSDPDFRITNASGTVARATNATPATDSALVSLSAGDHLLAVNDYRLSSALTCFSVSIQ